MLPIYEAFAWLVESMYHTGRINLVLHPKPMEINPIRDMALVRYVATDGERERESRLKYLLVCSVPVKCITSPVVSADLQSTQQLTTTNKQDTLDLYTYDDTNHYLYTMGHLRYLMISDFGIPSEPKVTNLAVKLNDELDEVPIMAVRNSQMPRCVKAGIL